MGHSIEELQRIGVKFYLAEGAEPNLSKVIAAFHRWIRNSSVEGLLIDVADYAHVPEGPGALLVAHEGNYALDFAGGRPGVVYYRKHAADGDLAARLRSAARNALQAASLLENDPELEGAIEIGGDELQIFANDRLLAPNSDETEAGFRPVVDTLLDALFPGVACKHCRDQNPGERFNIDIKASQKSDAKTLLARL